MANLSRRNFLTAFTSSVLGFGLARKVKAGSKNTGIAQEGTSPIRIQKYNDLGKTGIKVPDVSCGAISFFEPNVLRYAYDLGVTYFDTAEGYMRTKSETFIGEALKDVRDKVTITTKHGYFSIKKIKKEGIIKRIEASLMRLQSDHIDIAMVHGVSDMAFLENEELQAAYAQLKKQGKIRFTGFSTHNAVLTLKQALDNDFAQVILFIYSHMEGEEIEPLIEQARKKGIGMVAMKIFAGGKHANLKTLVSQEVSYPQAAIRWVISNSNVDCCIPTMSSYSHVEEYVEASGKPLDRASLEMIAEYQRQTKNQYCRVSCSQCLSSCPNDVAINDVLRYSMYFEDYGMEKDAMGYYADIAANKKPLNCAHCAGYCEKACPYGLKVQDKLIHANEILTA
ncbi:MAG: aldo/keto reductase [Candidatus Aminicenantes bacterium]|nr:MAG: aldo/keto reductase [Candidatus Aminicenantes bacterium]